MFKNNNGVDSEVLTDLVTPDTEVDLVPLEVPSEEVNGDLQLNPLEEAIYDWAQANGYSQNAMVSMLAAATNDGSNLAFWGSVNMLDALPQAQFQASTSSLRLATFLTTFRNVLIFLPVALTWAAISVATSAFGTFSSQNQATTVNFLAFWQNGYGYLADFWHIDEVAKLDTIIVAFIILLTLAIARLNNANDRAYDAGFIIADEQRLVLAMELQNYFHANREITSETVSETVAESVAGLRDMAREMTSAMTELKVVMGKMSDTVPQVDNLSREIVTIGVASSERISELVNTLTNGVNSATGLIDELGSSVSTLGKEAKQAAQSITEVESSILGTSESLNNIVSGFETSIAGVKSELDNGLANALDRAADTIAVVVDEMEVTGNSLKSSARSVQDQLETFQRSLRTEIKK